MSARPEGWLQYVYPRGGVAHWFERDADRPACGVHVDRVSAARAGKHEGTCRRCERSPAAQMDTARGQRMARARWGDREDWAARFWAKVDRPTMFGCWTWTGSRDAHGYGVCGGLPLANSRERRAYRAAYMLLVGPVPNGLTLDHLCRNTLCVNPAHLEPVTQGENNRRALPFIIAARTHCARGHAYPLATQGRRFCRECRRASHRNFMRTKRRVAA